MYLKSSDTNIDTKCGCIDCDNDHIVFDTDTMSFIENGKEVYNLDLSGVKIPINGNVSSRVFTIAKDSFATYNLGDNIISLTLLCTIPILWRFLLKQYGGTIKKNLVLEISPSGTLVKGKSNEFDITAAFSINTTTQSINWENIDSTTIYGQSIDNWNASITWSELDEKYLNHTKDDYVLMISSFTGKVLLDVAANGDISQTATITLDDYNSLVFAVSGNVDTNVIFTLTTDTNSIFGYDFDAIKTWNSSSSWNTTTYTYEATKIIMYHNANMYDSLSYFTSRHFHFPLKFPTSIKILNCNKNQDATIRIITTE
jgi:hypothetical protein